MLLYIYTVSLCSTIYVRHMDGRDGIGHEIGTTACIDPGHKSFVLPAFHQVSSE